MTNGSTTWNMTYNADGLRTKRTNGSTTYNYIYLGGQLVKMTFGANTITFNYDASGTPMSMVYNGTTYYYLTNLQGDVTGITTKAGAQVVAYTYDAWGRLLSTTGTSASTIGLNNPLRYRGYVFDRETGLYYLQSRYYSPKMGRFTSSDTVYDEDAGLQGYNLFVYCGNNPVNRIDICGADSDKMDDDMVDDDLESRGGGNGYSAPVGDGTGYKTFDQAKAAMGSAGEGKQWHHVVEQCQNQRVLFEHSKLFGFNACQGLARWTKFQRTVLVWTEGVA